MAEIAGILKSRWYPLNTKTWRVYVGKYHGDRRYGFPTNTLVFQEWRGTDITGIKGDAVLRMLKKGKIKIVARSLYRR